MKDGSVVIKFDSFFRNKLAEDKLGNQIGEDIWDYDSGTVQNRKVGCVFPMVVISILPPAELGPNDNREDTPHFTADRAAHF